MKIKKTLIFLCISTVLLGISPLTSYADYVFGFHGITFSNMNDVAIGEQQLFVETFDAGNNQILFSFYNIGTENSSIEGIYFQDGSLSQIAALFDSNDAIESQYGDPGVDFEQGATPPSLPSGSAVGFESHQSFQADSEPPTSHWGINPSESLGIYFDIDPNYTYSDVISQIMAGDIAIGLHVIAFDSGGSESFVNNLTPVPIPGALWLIGSGLLFFIRRNKRH